MNAEKRVETHIAIRGQFCDKRPSADRTVVMKKIVLGIVAAAFASSAAYAAANVAMKCCYDDLKNKAEQAAPRK